MLAIRHEPVRYQDWPTWRAMRVQPGRVRVVIFRACCSACAGRGQRIERNPRRNPDYGRMAHEDALRPPWLIAVVCATCDGTRVIEQRFAVMA